MGTGDRVVPTLASPERGFALPHLAETVSRVLGDEPGASSRVGWQLDVEVEAARVPAPAGGDPPPDGRDLAFHVRMAVLIIELVSVQRRRGVRVGDELSEGAYSDGAATEPPPCPGS